MSNKHFELEPGAVAVLNRRAKSVQRAAAKILEIPVPLVVFDESLQIPPETQFVEGPIEETIFGVSIMPERIKIHPRELITSVADEAARRFPGLPDQELSSRIDSQIWKFLILTTIKEPAQGREDFSKIVRQTFSVALADFALTEYGVTLSKKKSA